MVAPAYAVDYLSAEQAQRLLIPGADSFRAVGEPDEEQRDAIRARAGVRQRTDTQLVWRALSERANYSAGLSSMKSSASTNSSPMAPPSHRVP